MNLEKLENVSTAEINLLQNDEDDAEHTPKPRPARSRRPPWTTIATQCLFLIWLVLLIFLLGILSSQDVEIFMSDGFSRGSACVGENTFSPFMDHVNWWSADGIFEITIGFGSMSFAQAKVVDIVWDLIVGRVGQFVMSYITWKVLAMYVAVSLDQQPVGYSTFWMVFLRQEASLATTFQLLRDSAFVRALRRKTVMVFTIFSLFLVIFFPTAVSAMTGYSPKTEAFIRGSFDGSLIRFREFDPVAYVISDGSRINLTDSYVVPWIGTARDQSYYYPHDPLLKKDGMFYYDVDDCRMNSGFTCEMQIAVSNYVRAYGFNGVSNATGPTIFNNTLVQPPALNISGFWFPERGDRLRLHYPERFNHSLYGWEWQDPVTGSFPFRDIRNTHFSAAQEPNIDLDYVLANGVCQPSTDRYKWGFSYIQLFVLNILLILWTLGTCLMWACAVLEREVETPGQWKSVLHLAKTMAEQLGCIERGIDPNELENRELDRIVDEELERGRVMFGPNRTAESGGFMARSWGWIKSNRVWTVLFGMSYGAVLVMTPVFWSKHVEGSWVASMLLALFSVALFVVKAGRLREPLTQILPRVPVIAKGYLYLGSYLVVSFITRLPLPRRPDGVANSG
ncbi:hypothetical protein QBC42DRAFT_262282 [Cladorrhinum samala]|uniref:Uncharacterized protein n=1 Tax=Cladorrhinum samala TaxID=585594 RepID=A0AAV9HY31_9PEZI|nr:hypothetical protein QBC42DRAFT_262282 [Cladorrhinum samala]